MNIADIAKTLNRSPLVVRGLQERLEGEDYTPAYLALLRRLVLLRMLGIAEERLRELWHLEKKLLQLLHLDAAGSPTWFLDACDATEHPEQRLLLTNHDLGQDLASNGLQLALNFGQPTSELFSRAAMGEDALHVLQRCLSLRSAIHADLARERPNALAAARLAKAGSEPARTA
jgi:hypothetical protein